MSKTIGSVYKLCLADPIGERGHGVSLLGRPILLDLCREYEIGRETRAHPGTFLYAYSSMADAVKENGLYMFLQGDYVLLECVAEINYQGMLPRCFLQYVNKNEVVSSSILAWSCFEKNRREYFGIVGVENVCHGVACSWITPQRDVTDIIIAQHNKLVA